MSDFQIQKIFKRDQVKLKKVEDLLQNNGIKLDGNLDYICGIFDEDNELLATGSCFENTLRCVAVRNDLQGQGLLNQIVTHLLQIQQERGNFPVFVYTKVQTQAFFKDLGFFPIANVKDKLVFMENRKAAFAKYLSQLSRETNPTLFNTRAAIIMNANPFTLGHRYLIERACQEVDWVDLFIVSEEASLIPFNVRKQLIQAGTADLKNLSFHHTGDYLISKSTFPSYFLKDEDEVIQTQAQLDIEIFKKIAHQIGITHRYLGEEPYSRVTEIYNQLMKSSLELADIQVNIIPRLKANHQYISASLVRQALKEDKLEEIKEFLPFSTYNYFKSNSEAPKIIQKIKSATNVIHY
ncbi:[citrate (pro-3S)-lyase] ligase [Ignavigranum ruoffiae]|uniref:[citrate (pro-3S)-lyase] ligase n=1 Tax=Ignavigranum ruoffiae TaxID=89093 RepID=UPI0024AD3DC5|nr:[citrate (pro-3S)-lyase] ligase [Ignavigranum ruoffiae]